MAGPLSDEAKQNRRQFTRKIAKLGFGAAVLGALGLKTTQDAEAVVCYFQYYWCGTSSNCCAPMHGCPARYARYYCVFSGGGGYYSDRWLKCGCTA